MAMLITYQSISTYSFYVSPVLSTLYIDLVVEGQNKSIKSIFIEVFRILNVFPFLFFCWTTRLDQDEIEIRLAKFRATLLEKAEQDKKQLTYETDESGRVV